jgi:hypothetical protein
MPEFGPEKAKIGLGEEPAAIQPEREATLFFADLPKNLLPDTDKF